MSDLTEVHSPLEAAINQVFLIQDRTIGDSDSGFLYRFRGKLRSDDSEGLYDKLDLLVKPLGYTLLFRSSGEDQEILIIDRLPEGTTGRSSINLVLFLVTLISVWFTGGLLSAQNLSPNWAENIPGFITSGWPFAISMLGFLSAHEFGHYLMSRHHGVKATLPYFIPLPAPFSPFGTMGAVINMRQVPRNIRQLFDIGVTGPLAGLVVAIPVLIIGLLRSPLSTLPMPAPEGTPLMIQLEGNSILYLLSKFLVFGKLLPEPASYGGLSPFMYWIKYFFTGQPIPFGGLDVTLDPVAWAGWGALLITGLNLIPVGQFDGGHILYALIGRRNMKRLFPVMLGFTALMGFFWSGWWIWTALIYFLGRHNAEPLDTITQLDSKRKIIGVLALIIFILIFIPIPLKAI